MKDHSKHFRINHTQRESIEELVFRWVSDLDVYDESGIMVEEIVTYKERAL